MDEVSRHTLPPVPSPLAVAPRVHDQRTGIEIGSGNCPMPDLATSVLGCGNLQSFPTSSATMFLRRSLIAVLIITVAAFFSAQSVDAAKGPKITNKVYFDVKHGDKDLGRSSCLVLVHLCLRLADALSSRYGALRWCKHVCTVRTKHRTDVSSTRPSPRR